MNTQVKGAAKRLIFSLIVTSTLAGCAVYQPRYPGYAADPHLYRTPLYSGVPYYVGPPVSLGLLYGARSSDHRGHHGHHGGWGGGIGSAYDGARSPFFTRRYAPGFVAIAQAG